MQLTLGVPATTELTRFTTPAGVLGRDAQYELQSIGIPEPDGRHRVRYLAVRHPAIDAYTEVLLLNDGGTEMNVRGLSVGTHRRWEHPARDASDRELPGSRWWEAAGTAAQHDARAVR